MILSLSWKNIWRSKRRSFVVIGAIIIGVWSLIFMIAFYNSFITAFSKNAIAYDYSHIQVHNPNYLIEPDLKFQLTEAGELVEQIDGLENVQARTARQKVNGMLASPKSNTGVQVYGIDPAAEQTVTQLESQLVDGTYFTEISRNPILISQKLADKLKVKVRSKVVLTFQDTDNNIVSASFRIEGIFNSKSVKINEGVVYVRMEDLTRLTLTEGVNEVAVLIDNMDDILPARAQIQQFTSDTVRIYNEIAPEFNLMEQSSGMTKQILTIIIMLALLFGIVNTMLMAVLERTREIGMLRSVGMKKRSVFSMIILETSLMGLISGPVGLLLGYITVVYFNQNGMDLSQYEAALKDVGYDAVFYPEIEMYTYPILMVTVIITAFIGAIYPALKAIRLNPLEAIRKQ